VEQVTDSQDHEAHPTNRERLIDLIRFVFHYENASGRSRFLQFGVKIFSFFFHTKPPKLADQLKKLARWAMTILVDRNFSTLQIGVHHFAPLSG